MVIKIEIQAAQDTEAGEEDIGKPDTDSAFELDHIEVEVREKEQKPDSDESGEEVSSEMEEMQEMLRCKEKEFEEFRQSVENVIDEKSKEISDLIMSLGEIEDSQIQRQKEMSKIDAEMKMLNIRKTEIAQNCETADKEMKELEKKKMKLELFQQSFATETKTSRQKLQTEIDSLQEMVKGNPERNSIEPAPPPDAMPRAGPSFLGFLERQIEDMELECPVCFEIASQAPIFKCEEDHLICSKCQEKVTFCPVCRVDYPEGGGKRLRGAERSREAGSNVQGEGESSSVSVKCFWQLLGPEVNGRSFVIHKTI